MENSGLNTGGQVRMYHVPGLTPEAPTLEAAFNKTSCKHKIGIGRGDLKRIYDMLNYASNENVDFVFLGCPHYNIQEIQKVARLLDGKKCKSALWVMTNPISYQVAERMGYAAASGRYPDVRRVSGHIARRDAAGLGYGDGRREAELLYDGPRLPQSAGYLVWNHRGLH